LKDNLDEYVYLILVLDLLAFNSM